MSAVGAATRRRAARTGAVRWSLPTSPTRRCCRCRLRQPTTRGAPTSPRTPRHDSTTSRPDDDARPRRPTPAGDRRGTSRCARGRRGRRSRCPRPTRRRRRPASAPTTTAASCSTRSSPRTRSSPASTCCPGNPDVVHHVILFRVPPDEVAERRADRRRRRRARAGPASAAPASAATGRDARRRPVARRLGPGRQRVGATRRASASRSRRARQVDHAGPLQPARRAASPTAAPPSCGSRPATAEITPLETMLLPAPVELPCRPARPTARCATATRRSPTSRPRFGEGPGSPGRPAAPPLRRPTTPAPCRPATARRTQAETIRGVAGHMHLLGRVDQDRGQPGHADARPSSTSRSGTSTTRAAGRSSRCRLEPRRHRSR